MKRTLDVAASALSLIVLAPAFLLIALGIACSSPGPVLFTQQRVGRNGRLFRIYKFRSMHIAPVAEVETWVDDPRIFPFGRVLREYHLDELPQLWNVLLGDMSLVGPRPTLLSQVERYSPRERGRLDVRPGLTGLAQVSGGNALDWNDRIEIDLCYVRDHGITRDVGILLRTVLTVVRKEGLYAADGRVHDKR